ncbi:NAD(P)H-dependent oxidoreductase [Pseudomonas sp. CDFA 602]|uniref:FMN-dependent NADH-azoreductase n=1 Tax=Pseudomonas californiensis TaxID=2829823 RepID=UPI001E63E8B5|nr:NAD(P)H-dependent oxidoreductase [Pseudomonas californiensis]MCD5992616.1 NAD(P)H-dependent oxidoreductase [Pseudomonas californiensis]MCD5998106.1 NAD(P)H-dependent oxidoreductase [Pseudomonas californiensis]
MNNVLLINASPQGSASHAHQLALELVASLRHRYPNLRLTQREVGTIPLPPLGLEYARALTTRTPFDAPVFDVSEGLIRELEACDVLIIATPMHNFSLPAALKLWIDYVLRIERTFRSGPEGKTGLLVDRPVYVLVGSGGYHQGEGARQPDFLTSYLRVVLNTLGLFDTHFTYLQGLVSSEDEVRSVLDQARRKLVLQPLFSQLTCA